MMAVLSSRVLDHEHSYQAFTVGILLKLHGAYSMYADGERGKGYYDILLKSNSPCDPHIIMEFKKTRSNASDDTLRKTSENALEQIRDSKYFHGLKGDVLMHGKRYAERMSWCHPIPCPCDPLPENIHKCSGEDRSPYKATVEDLKP